MKMKRKLFASLIIILIFSCCSREKNYVSDDLKTLNKLITLPGKPISAKFKTEQLGDESFIELGPKDYNLAAIIVYPKNQFDSLKTVIEAQSESQSKTYKSDEINTLFKDTIKRRFNFNDAIFTVERTYEPKLFFKNSYRHGECFFGNENEIYLNLYAL